MLQHAIQGEKVSAAGQLVQTIIADYMSIVLYSGTFNLMLHNHNNNYYYIQDTVYMM